MTTVEYFNNYEIFALCANNSSEALAFNEFRADLGDGYRQQALYGAATGSRSWNLSYQNLAGSGYQQSVSLDNHALSAAAYLQDLFARTKVSGKPFVVKSPVSGQYYLAEFADSSISFEKSLVKLFSVGINLRQVRLRGVTVFDPSKIAEVSHFYQTPIAGATDGAGLPSSVWANSIAGGDNLDALTGITYETNEQNGRDIVRLTQGGSTCALTTNPSTSFYEAFLVMKYRTATFPNYNGIIANNDNSSGQPALDGNQGTNKFFNFGFGSSYSYRLNGLDYPESNQVAPMNAFGLVHIRNTTGWTMPQGLVFGKDRPSVYPLRKSNVDFGEIVICREPLTASAGLEMEEYLITKWKL